ncbi:11699_t:CDS:2 [Entrophospora sp. SA101]|nr:11699_t:CDS:2 [Entrophospora sp. SA101]
MDMDLDEYSEETYKHSVLRLAGSKTIVTDDLKDEYFKKKTINAMISLLKGAVNKINGTHQQPGSNLLAMMGQGPLSRKPSTNATKVGVCNRL